MPYTYVSAWTINGGINLPPKLDPQELHRSDRCAFALTTNPDKYLRKIDLSSAIGNVILRGIFTKEASAEFDTELEKSAEEIRLARQKASGSPILIAEGYGTALVSMERSANKDGYIVVLDGVNKAPIINDHAEELESMKLALGFERESPSNFSKLAEGVYFTDSVGQTVFSLTFSLSANLHLSTELSSEGARNISSRFVALQSTPALNSIKRLYSRMAEHESDPLKAFLFGWSALEILIAKSFSKYEEDFLSPLLEGPQAALRGRFLSRVRAVMSDKYRLSDKFNCVSSVLFANADEIHVNADAERFDRIKKVRDKIMHGDDFNPGDLPVKELAALLRKYVIAYLSMNPPP
jgi:hypothetical protein